MIALLRSLNEGMKQALQMVLSLACHVYDLAYEWAGLIVLVLCVWFVVAAVIAAWR